MRAKLKVVILLFFIALGIGYVFLLTWEHSNTYYISIDKDFNMSDEELIAVAKECLKLDGLDISRLHPVSLRHNYAKLVGRNDNNPNSSQTIWQKASSPHYYDYYVAMEKQPNNQMQCIVGQPH